MGQFIYKAIDRGGVHMSGTIDAADRSAAVATLTAKGHFVTELREESDGDTKSLKAEKGGASILSKGFALPFLSRVSSKDVTAMTTQFSTALRAGLPLLNCLELIGNQQRKPANKKMFEQITHDVSSGKSLSEAMSEFPNTFSPLYISMIRVGETGGILEQTSTQLAGILNREEKVKSNLKSASAYPIFVLCLGIVSVVVIVGWILPNILNTITESGNATLPLPTQILLMISNTSRQIFTSLWGWIGIVAIIAGFIYFRHWKKHAGRCYWDAFILKIPILGNVLRTIAVGRFTRTLGSLTQGGVTILEALSVVRDTLGNEILGRQIDDVGEKVKRGASVAEPLEETGYFPPLLIQIVSIGEQTGKLDELLLNAAETFDSEADAAINRFMAIFPAFLILLLALIVGFIIIATLLPIVSMTMGAGTF